MNKKILITLGLILVLAGGAGLYFGEFRYEKEVASGFGVSLEKTERVAIPTWAAVLVIGIGGALVGAGALRRK